MDADTRLKTEEKIIAMLKTVYDPEIPVNIYDLGSVSYTHLTLPTICSV